METSHVWARNPADDGECAVGYPGPGGGGELFEFRASARKRDVPCLHVRADELLQHLMRVSELPRKGIQPRAHPCQSSEERLPGVGAREGQVPNVFLPQEGVQACAVAV